MHGNIIPILLFLTLGVCVSVVVNRFKVNRWLAIFLSAAVTTVVWGVGVYLLLLITAPHELEGGIVLRPAVFAFLLAIVPALFVSVFRARICTSPAKS